MEDHGKRVRIDFPTTPWSMIRRAGEEGGESPREALGELLRRYLPALRSHLLHNRTVPPDRVDDLLQGFVSDQILQRDLLSRADDRRGKFRALLLTVLERYIASQRRYDSAQKRSPERSFSLHAEGGEDLAVDRRTAADWLDAAWAREVLNETLHRMQRECRVRRRPDIWGVFEARMLGPAVHGGRPLPYRELVERFHLSTPRQASNVLITGKRMFVRILRTVVGEYTPEEEIEAEIRELQEALSGGEGRGRS